MKTGIVYNPNATGFNKKVLDRAYANFRNQGMTVQTYESIHAGKTPDLVKRANKSNDLVVTLGGDGTLGEAFEAFNEVEQTAPYIHIPTGTANDTADNFGLFKGQPLKSINLYSDLSSCEEVDVDMVTNNNVPFAYVSCTGTFTNLTYNTPTIFKQALGKLGYYTFAGLTGVATVPDVINPPLRLKYKKNGKIITTDALAFFVSNSKTFAGFKLFKDARIYDGFFEVTILKSLPESELLQFLKELLGNEGRNLDINAYPRYIDTFTTDNFKVTMLKGSKNVDFNHDGDKKVISLNTDRTIEYKTTQKVKMLLPTKTN